MLSNDSGGRCSCSEAIVDLDRQYNAMMNAFNAELERINATMDQITMGDSFQIQSTPRATELVMECQGEDDLTCHIGAARYNAVDAFCTAQVTPECQASHDFIRMQYSQNIRTDCAAYQRAIESQRSQGAQAILAARQQVTDAALEQFNEQNILNASECGRELENCMSSANACGPDWSRCVATGVEGRRMMCERVLERCVAVADQVWSDFVGRIAPTLNRMRLASESTNRQSCLRRVSDCVVRACEDNIGGIVSSLDACLSRPELVQSFCRVEMDDCPQDNDILWDLVTSMLGALRIDRCNEEVRGCFTHASACGEDFSNCIGMDYNTLLAMCPVERLVVCRQDRENFGMRDIEDIIMGIMLQIDNSAMDRCQELIEDKMFEICGDTTDCENFTNSLVGTNSLQLHGRRVLGNIRWGAVMVSNGSEWAACTRARRANCDQYTRPGTILGDIYLENPTVDEAIVGAEIRSVMREAEALIMLLEQDTEINFCINGRDLSNISLDGGQTTARFPAMTHIPRMILANAVLRQAEENYIRRLGELRERARQFAEESGARNCSMPNAPSAPPSPRISTRNGFLGIGSRATIRSPRPHDLSLYEIVCD